MKPSRAADGRRMEETIRHDDVKMNVQVERAAEALDERHRAELAHREAQALCLKPQMGSDGAEKNAQDAPEELVVAGDEVPDAKGQ